MPSSARSGLFGEQALRYGLTEYLGFGYKLRLYFNHLHILSGFFYVWVLDFCHSSLFWRDLTLFPGVTLFDIITIVI